MWTVVGEGVSLPELPAPGAVPLFLSLHSPVSGDPRFSHSAEQERGVRLALGGGREHVYKFIKSSGLLGGSVG